MAYTVGISPPSEGRGSGGRLVAVTIVVPVSAVIAFKPVH